MTHILNSQDTGFHRNKEQFQLALRDFRTYMNESTYWQKIKLTGYMLSFLTMVSAIFFGFFHRKGIYAALVGLDETAKVYRANTAQLCTVLEQHIFTLSTLSSVIDKDESTAKSIMSFTTLVIVSIKIFAISVCLWRQYSFKLSLMRVCVSLYPVSKWLWEMAHSENGQLIYVIVYLGISCIIGCISNQI